MTSETPDIQNTGPPAEPVRRRGYRRFFVRGLALILPTLLTVLILVKAWQFVDQHIISYVNDIIQGLLSKHTGFDDVFGKTYDNWWLQNLVITPVYWFMHYFLGFVVSILFVYAAGILMTNFVGRRLWHVFESRLMKFPVIRFVYPFVKQVTDFLFSENKLEYRAVVAVEYPRKGIWSLGLVTGKGFAEITRRSGRSLVTIFVPSSPTPVTGYVIFAASDEVIPLDITVDEAFRLIVSGGVITPEARPKALAGGDVSAKTAGGAAVKRDQEGPQSAEGLEGK